MLCLLVGELEVVKADLNERIKRTANQLRSLYLDAEVILKIERACEPIEFYGKARFALPDYQASFVVGENFERFSSKYHHFADEAVKEAIVITRKHIADLLWKRRLRERDNRPELVHHIPHDHQVMCYGCMSKYPHCIKCRVCNGHAYIGLRILGKPRRINWTRLCKRQVYGEQGKRN